MNKNKNKNKTINIGVISNCMYLDGDPFKVFL